MTGRRLVDVVRLRRWTGASEQTLRRLAGLLREEGVEITHATSAELARGTPVYADASADIDAVQRAMARNHILRLPVLEDGRMLGLVDLVEVALQVEPNAGAGRGARR